MDFRLYLFIALGVGLVFVIALMIVASKTTYYGGSKPYNYIYTVLLIVGLMIYLGCILTLRLIL